MEQKWTEKQRQKRFEKWGFQNCKDAHHENRVVGNGANTIGHEMGFTTNQIDAMIDTYDDHLGELIWDNGEYEDE